MAIVLNGTTGIQFPPSTALSPSATNTTSTDTGIYYPTGTTLGFATSGVERMRIDSSGNVGIGTASPAAKLQVTGGAIMPAFGNSSSAGIQFPPDPGGGSGDAAWIRYYVRSGESTTLEIGINNDADDNIALMSSGGVGIGTTSMLAKLHVNKGSAGNLAYFTDGINADFYIKTVSLTTTIGPNAGSTSMVFQTSSTEKMRIDNIGNVGIGTDAPNAKLDIYGGSLGGTLGNQIIIERLHTYNANASYLDFSSIRDAAGVTWDTAGSRLQQKIDSTWMSWMQFNGNDNRGGMAFGTGTSTSGPLNVVERMRINDSGCVGIGTNNPIRKFVVSDGGVKGMELSPATGSLGGNEWINYNRSTLAYVPSEVFASTHAFYTGTVGEARMVDINTTGLNVGVNNGTTGGTLSVFGGVSIKPTVYGGSSSAGSDVGTYTLGNGKFFIGGDQNPIYVHIVLPARYNIVNSKMFCLEIKGYAYGDSVIINIMISGYVTTIINGGPMQHVAVWDAMNHFSPTAYYSYNYNAGIARIYLPNQYYATFTVNSIAVGNGDIITPSELRIIQSTSATI